MGCNILLYNTTADYRVFVPLLQKILIPELPRDLQPGATLIWKYILRPNGYNYDDIFASILSFMNTLARTKSPNDPQKLINKYNKISDLAQVGRFEDWCRRDFSRWNNEYLNDSRENLQSAMAAFLNSPFVPWVLKEPVANNSQELKDSIKDWLSTYLTIQLDPVVTKMCIQTLVPGHPIQPAIKNGSPMDIGP